MHYSDFPGPILNDWLDDAKAGGVSVSLASFPERVRLPFNFRHALLGTLDDVT